MSAIDSLRSVLRRLDALGTRHALVGGLAVSARSEPRFTRDADVAVAVATDSEAESIVRELLHAGFISSMTVEQQATGRLATVRLTPDANPESSFVDLLFASSGIEPEIVAGASHLEVIPGLFVPVASAGHLIAMKLLSESPDRFQDGADLLSLLRVASKDDLETAEAAIALITARGTNRGKDLGSRLRHYQRLASDP